MSLSHNLPVNYTYFRDQVTSTSDKSHGSFISTGVRVSRVVDTPVVIANIEPSLYHQYIDVYGYLHATSNHDSDSDRAPMPNPAVAVAVASTINFPRFLEGTSLENHDAFNPFQRDPLHSIIHSSFYNSEDKQLEPNTNIRSKLAGRNISKVSKVLLYDHVWFQKNMKVEYSSENW
ncbi:hypothetical protein FRC19_005031 [Serendipita sp. 401]|nr:hypothetical protein FRC19_005031 [Serendipita sp. 401]